MSYEVNFGSIRAGGAGPRAKKSGTFRVAVLGDFSARASGGKLDTGTALAARKPVKVDCDNLDATLKRFGVNLRLAVGVGGGVVEVPVKSMDDLHPDQLFNNLPIFSELSGLRQRLKNSSTFAKAAQEIQAWGNLSAPAPERLRPRSTVIPANAKLSDFARLVGKPTVPPTVTSSVAELLKHMIGPYVVPAKDPRQDQLVSTVDASLAAAMRSVLHHPDFQSFEALWRSVDFLVRRLETDQQLQIVLYDVTAEELAADLSQANDLENSGLYKLLVEQPALDADQGVFAVVVGNYLFEQTPPHAELLGRIAKVVGQTQTAFLAGIGTNCLETKPADLHRLIRESWDALAEIPEAGYLGLVVPRFMLRLPYGERTDPIESFDFEEFTAQDGLKGMLWGNSAVIAGLLLGATFLKSSASSRMELGTILSVGEMPFYYYTDSDGDQTALPCTERMVSSKTAELVAQYRFMPMLSIKGRTEVRLGGFGSLAGGLLAGPWKPINSSSAEKAKTTEINQNNKSSRKTEKPEEPTKPQEETGPASGAVAESTATSVSAEESLEEPTVDPELDKLLADLEDKVPEAAASAEHGTEGEVEPPMDPELAKMLADLG